MILFSGCNQGSEDGTYEFYQSFEVSARTQGVVFKPAESGTYRFTITGGAYTLGDRKWATALVIYVDRPVETTPSTKGRAHPANPDASIGDFEGQDSKALAEQTGLEEQAVIEVQGSAIFIVPDDLGTFEDNSGGIRMMVERKQ